VPNDIRAEGLGIGPVPSSEQDKGAEGLGIGAVPRGLGQSPPAVCVRARCQIGSSRLAARNRLGDLIGRSQTKYPIPSLAPSPTPFPCRYLTAFPL
jgi:hypothetical protein